MQSENCFMTALKIVIAVSLINNDKAMAF